MHSEMKMLVTVDGSTFAEAVIPAAIKVAQSLGASVEYVAVHETDILRAGTDLDDKRFREWLAGYLVDLVERTRAVWTVEVGSVLLEGAATQRIVEHAKRSGADLVAMATHGRGAVSRAWLGSVADYVVHHLEVPVLLVRADEDNAPDFTTPVAFHNIVVALDGSERAEQSLELTARLADAWDATLTLLRAVPPPTPFVTAPTYMPHAIEATQTALERGTEESEAYLAEVDRQLRGRGLHVATKVLVGTSPAHGILEHIAAESTDLVAIASHGRTGLKRVLLGSVADKIVRAAPVPVLLTRVPREHATTGHGAGAAEAHGRE